jgi:hypothetical protein
MNSTSSSNNDSVENALHALLSRRIPGVLKVANVCGLICVHVRSARSAQSVRIDLLRSRGFSSVNVQKNCIDGGFTVAACPKPQ